MLTFVEEIYTDENQTQLQEDVASIIFDFGDDEDFVRPSEETCAKLATLIVNRFFSFLDDNLGD